MSAPTQPDELANIDHVTFANMEQHEWLVQRVCPDWRKEEVTSTDHTWLTNDVHPAFAEDRFFDAEGFNHQETLLARRFASRLLEADCVIPFWWALLFGGASLTGGGGEWLNADAKKDEERELQARAARIPALTDGDVRKIGMDGIIEAIRTVDNARLPKRLLSFADPPSSRTDAPGGRREAMTHEQFILTKATLRGLGRSIKYKLWSGSGIKCLTLWYSRAIDSRFRGSPSGIVINPQELRIHSTAMKGDMISQAWASVSLGFKLLQQVAHAAVAASRSGAECNWTNQYEFDGAYSMGAEVRMLESCTFGGELRKEHEMYSTSHYTIDGAEGVPGLWFAYSDYASAGIEEMFGDVTDEEADVGPFYYREWQVPFSWFLEVLTDDFWDVDVRKRGQPALEPPKEFGYVMSRDNEKKYGPYHKDDVREGVVPAGWRMLPRSYVITSNELRREAKGAILFGGFGVGRIALDSDDDLQGSERAESSITDDTSLSDSSAEDDDDASMEDAPEGNTLLDATLMADALMEDALMEDDDV